MGDQKTPTLKSPLTKVDLSEFGVPAWWVRMFDVTERDAFFERVKASRDQALKQGPGAQMAPVVQVTAVSETGARLFPDGEAGLAAVMALPSKALDLLGRAALKVNGMSVEAAEDAEKN